MVFIMLRWDPMRKSYFGKEQIRRGVQAFFDRFPDGKFENLKVAVAGDIGTFEWDFVTTALQMARSSSIPAVCERRS